MKTNGILFIVIFVFLAITSINAQISEKINSEISVVGNAGTEYYFSVPPGIFPGGSGGDEIIIYISSNVRTKVLLEIKGKGYEKTKYTEPNEVIEFHLPSIIAQPYRKLSDDRPEKDSVYEDYAIHIVAENPILCYSASRFLYKGEALLILPVESLGNEYIISSFADHSNNTDKWYPSYVTITAPNDNTEVTFKLGGTATTETAGGQKSGETQKYNLNSGDVLCIGTIGTGSELSGSKITSSEPVAVVSGNFCANVPSNCEECNILQEMEIPTNLWGKVYHVTRIGNRLKNSIIKIYAKEDNTTIYRDCQEIGKISTAGGTLGTGYLEIRADEGPPRPVIISADKPIGITQYNSSKTDDGVNIAPFQMSLVPTYLYQKEISFHTPGVDKGFGFTNKFINLVYEATEFGTIPEDLEFAMITGEEWYWQKMMDMSPSPGDPFMQCVGEKKYYIKTMKLPKDGFYKIRSSKPFQAYSWGYTENFDSYGMPAFIGNSILSDNPQDFKDTLPPQITYKINCGDVEGKIIDVSNTISTSKIASISMTNDLSYNYKLSFKEFIPCQSDTVKFNLKILDCTQDASALISFSDCEGNSSSKRINYKANIFGLSSHNFLFENVQTGIEYTEMLWIINRKSSEFLVLNNLHLSSNNSNFSLLNSNMETIQLPINIYPSDSIAIIVKFQSNVDGRFRDTILVGDSCCLTKIPLEAYTTGTGIENIRDTEVKIFPNPAKDILFIENLPYFCSELQVYDILGSRIESFGLENYDYFDLNISEFLNGIYYLRIISPKEIFYYRFTVIH